MNKPTGVFSGGALSSMSLLEETNNSNSNSNSGTHSIINNRLDLGKCTYCQNSLGNVSIKCSECNNFFLCLKCFSMSAEIGEHKKDHNYFLKSSINFPLFDSESLWTYKEELLLLQFIEQYGFGNWDEIAKHLPSRTADECMQHYHSYYIYGNLGKNTFTNLSCVTKSQATSGTINRSIKTEPKSIDSTFTKGKNSQTSFNNETPTSCEMATTVLLPPIEMSIEEQRALGYMPLRDDFEREYKNDAETLLSNLTIANSQLSLLNNLISSSSNLKEEEDSFYNLATMFQANTHHNNYHSSASSTSSSLSSASSSANPNSSASFDNNEDAIEFDLKLTLIQIYRECLIERQRFKQIAREYGLINNASGLINKHNNLNNPNPAFKTNSQYHIISCLNRNLNLNVPRVGRKRKCPNEEKEMSELNEKLKKYAQVMTVSDYEILLENLRKQRQLCKQIQELNFYRNQLGFTKLNEIENHKNLSSIKKPSNYLNNSCKKDLGGDSSLTRTPRGKRKKSLLSTSTNDLALTPSKRLTRQQQYQQNLFNPISLSSSKKQANETNTSLNLNDDLNVSNIRNFSTSSSSRSSSDNSRNKLKKINHMSSRSSSRSRTNSTNSMTNYELVESLSEKNKINKKKNKKIKKDKKVKNDLESELISDDQEMESEQSSIVCAGKANGTSENSDDGNVFSDEESFDEYAEDNEDEDGDDNDDEDDDEEDEDENSNQSDDEELRNINDLYDSEENKVEVLDEDEDDFNEDLSSGGAASSGGSGINEINHDERFKNERLLRQMNGRKAEKTKKQILTTPNKLNTSTRCAVALAKQKQLRNSPSKQTELKSSLEKKSKQNLSKKKNKKKKTKLST